jgi:hypothetical protein
VHPHEPLREWLGRLLGPRRPVEFEPSDDRVLTAFAELFTGSGLAAFAANKQERPDALTLVYDCWTESMRGPADAAEVFSVVWTPDRQGSDPLPGFRTGEDSILLGTAPTVAMPQDERTEALLLLVTSRFVRLSAARGDPGPVVQGVLDDGGSGYRFLELDRPAVAAADPGP